LFPSISTKQHWTPLMILSYQPTAISYQPKAFFVLADCCMLTADCWFTEGAT